MRLFITLAIPAMLILLLGMALRDVYRQGSNIAFTIGAILIGLAAGGLFGWY